MAHSKHQPGVEQQSSRRRPVRWIHHQARLPPRREPNISPMAALRSGVPASVTRAAFSASPVSLPPVQPCCKAMRDGRRMGAEQGRSAEQGGRQAGRHRWQLRRK